MKLIQMHPGKPPEPQFTWKHELLMPVAYVVAAGAVILIFTAGFLSDLANGRLKQQAKPRSNKIWS